MTQTTIIDNVNASLASEALSNAGINHMVKGGKIACSHPPAKVGKLLHRAGLTGFSVTV